MPRHAAPRSQDVARLTLGAPRPRHAASCVQTGSTPKPAPAPLLGTTAGLGPVPTQQPNGFARAPRSARPGAAHSCRARPRRPSAGMPRPDHPTEAATESRAACGSPLTPHHSSHTDWPQHQATPRPRGVLGASSRDHAERVRRAHPRPRRLHAQRPLMGVDQSGGFVRLVFESLAGEHC
jgi:hypothetical protein